jgi:regulator of sigma E protease
MTIDIVNFIVILSILVLVHELGHFFAAKKAGIWVEEFGFGLPPRLFGKKFGETLYSINLLPFGGFVRLHGENTEESITKPGRAFLNKSKMVRSGIILAGVIMNFILAIFAFSVFYTFTGIPDGTVETGQVQVVGIAKDSPAGQSGLQDGDIVTKIDDTSITTSGELISTVNDNLGHEITMTVERNGETKQIITTPRENPPEGEGALGIAISSTRVQYLFPPLWKRLPLGIYYGFKEAIFWGGVIISGLFTMIKSLFMGHVPSDIAGPAGLLALTSEVTKQGFFATVNWLGIISVNLAILNVIPFPALDGGRLLFIFIEKIFGRRVLPKVESIIHTVGFALLILLIVAITVREVRLISQYGFSGYVDYLTQTQSP